jgi:hypothetical protein
LLEDGYESVFGSKGHLGTLPQPLHCFVNREHFLLGLRLDVARDVQIPVINGDIVECDHADISPVTALRNLKAVVLRELDGILVTA